MKKWFEVLKQADDAYSLAAVLYFIFIMFYFENKQEIDNDTMTTQESVKTLEEILNRTFRLPKH